MSDEVVDETQAQSWESALARVREWLGVDASVGTDRSCTTVERLLAVVSEGLRRQPQCQAEHALREVRDALELSPTVPDETVVKTVALQRETLAMIDRDLADRDVTLGADADLAMRVGMRWGAALASAWWDPASAEQLARALFEASLTVSRARGSEPIPLFHTSSWEDATDKRKDWWREVAVTTLDGIGMHVPTSLLPVTPEQLARAFHAGLGAESKVLSGELVWLPWEQMHPSTVRRYIGIGKAALSELPQIARTDAETGDEFAVHANEAIIKYQGMVSTLAAQRDRAQAEADRHLASSKGLQAALNEVAETLGMSFGRGFEGDTVKPMIIEAIGQLKRAHGRDEAGGKPTRPDAGLLSATPERLAKAWLETPTAAGLGFPWEQVHPDVRGEFIEHARRVIKALSPSWSALTNAMRKSSMMLPGEAFVFGADGPQRIKFDKAPEVPELDLESVAAAFGKRVEGSIEFDAPALSEYVKSMVDPEKMALLAQLRSQGAALQGMRREVRDMRVSLASVLGLPDQASGGEWPWAHLLSRVSELVRNEQNVQALSRKHSDDLRQALGSIMLGWDDLIRKVGELSGASARARREASDRRQDLQRALGIEDSLSWGDLISNVVVHVRNSGKTDAFRNESDARLRDLRDALGDCGGNVPWVALLDQVRELVNAADGLRSELANTKLGCLVASRMPDGTSHADVMVTLNQAATTLADIRHRLALDPATPVHVVLREVANLVKRADGAHSLASNAITEINDILGIEGKSFPARTVDAIRSLKSSWELMEEWYPRVVEALGVETDTTFDQNIPAAVGNALDRVRELQSGAHYRARSSELAGALGLAEATNWEWRSLLRRVEKFHRSAVLASDDAQDARRIRDAVLTLLDAAGIDERTNVDAVVQKTGDAAAILRSWPDVLRAVKAFRDEDVEQPDEVAPTLQGYAEKFAWADPPGLFKALERLLAAHRGEPLRDDAATMYERVDNLVKRLHAVVEETGRAHGIEYTLGESKVTFADLVLMQIRNHVAMSPSAMWASFAEQIAERLERMSRTNVVSNSPDFVSRMEDLPLHRHTLRHAAIQVRAHAAALVSGEESHPLVMALRDNTFWSPGAGLSSGMASELEMVPLGDGAVTLRTEEHGAIQMSLGRLELASVGAALLALSFHQVREAGRERQRMARLADKALAAAADPEMTRLISAQQVAEAAQPSEKTLRVLTATQIWTQGPNALDADPGKRWHVGCGGEVKLFNDDDEGTCQSCGQGCVPEGAPAITVTQVAVPGGYVAVAADGDAELEPLKWSYGPTSDDPDPGKMWHDDCGGEILKFAEGLICRSCTQHSGDDS